MMNVTLWRSLTHRLALMAVLIMTGLVFAACAAHDRAEDQEILSTGTLIEETHFPTGTRLWNGMHVFGR